MTILDTIVEHKRSEIACCKRQVATAVLQEQCRAECVRVPSFSSALLSVPMGIIAEVKYRSPSAGVIREPFDPAAIARAYERGGAMAISVLMDERYFGGGEQQMTAVRRAVSLPLLYKEFVVDEWQLWHAASLGASAVLLIASVLNDDEAMRLASVSRDAGLEVLFEVHDECEMQRALALGMSCIGINNRDLKTFKVDLNTSIQLAAMAAGRASLLVSESGIRSKADVNILQQSGIDAMLVGQHLLEQPDLSQAVRELIPS